MDYKIHETSLGTFLLKPDLVAESLKLGNFWEEELLPIFEKLTSDMVVIEVGSFIGDHTIYLSQKCKKVYALEASKPNYYQLCANLLLNNCMNVDAYNTCVGISGDRIKLSYVAEGNTAGTVYKKDSSGDLITYSLDDFFLNTIERLDYIITDVEGMDLDVLRGARGLLDKFKPLINFEYNDYHSVPTIDEYTSYLNMLGYSVSKVSTWNWLAEYSE